MFALRFISLCCYTVVAIVIGQLTCCHCASILGLFINRHRSHLVVYASLVEVLLERGHHVTIVTVLNISSFTTIKSANIGNLRLIKLDTNINTEENGSAPGKQQLEQMLERIRYTSVFLEDPKWQAFMQERQSYDLMLLGYLFNDYQLGVAAHFACPSIIIWTGQPIGFVNSLMGNPEERSYVTQPYERHQYTGAQAVAFGVFEWFVEWMALHVMHQIYEKHFPSPKYPSFEMMRKNVSLAFLNHHTISEGPIAPYLPNMVDIGGIQNERNALAKLPNGLLKSLRTNDTWIFISLGTHVQWQSLPAYTLQIFVEALNELSPVYKIIWTFDGNCLALENISSSIYCASWWPQATILAQPQTKLFITHGGKGSIAEALFHAVPMLGIPIFGDQHANVAKLVSSSVALKLDVETFTKKQLKRALKTLLQNETFYERMKNLSQRYRDRPLTARESAIFWVEYVLRHKGAAHMRSPRVHLNIWQTNNIDVYTFVLAVLGVTILLFNALERILNLN